MAGKGLQEKTRMAEIKEIIRQTQNKFLNMFEFKGKNKVGHDFRYFVASRAEKERLAAELCELLVPRVVLIRFLLERVEFFEILLAVGVIVAELGNHVVNGAPNRLDRVHRTIVVVAGERSRRSRLIGERCEREA